MKSLEKNEIRFFGLAISPSRISVNVSYNRGTFEIFYEFDRRVSSTSSLVALALATLCGRAFERIVFDFEVDRVSLNVIRAFSRSEVEALEGGSSPLRHGTSGNVLSFSGGFDSMAALALMPEDTRLVSLDFGGWFTREARFFRKFEPVIVTTNLRRVPDQPSSLARNHWTFMATGAILCADYFDARYHTFGSILGATFAKSSPNPRRVPLLEAAGYTDASYTDGITEAGTAKILLHYRPDLVVESIASLAGDRDRKRFLKTALIELMSGRLVTPPDISLNLPDQWKDQIDFTSSYTTALAALYFYHCGRGELIEPLFSSLPGDIASFVKSHDLSFMEKVNFDHVSNLSAELWPDYFEKLARYGFRPYSERDWEEVRAVRQYLNNIVSP